ncbi:MAG: NUDIX hydrolase [Bacillota bacterium]|nr:NUDIX hydrolase [Bacillota bacterium]
MNEKRGNVWLAVTGLVKSPDGKWLVVKKRYGGLKGKWSLPAGFVNAGETADEAVLREIKEETGIDCKLKGLIGLRTGVIKGDISDNMLMFELETKSLEIRHQEAELYEAEFITPEDLENDGDTSILLHYLMEEKTTTVKPCIDGINPGNQFGYTSYKIFL